MKMVYLIIGVIVVLAILLLTGRKSVHSELTINANTEVAWQVLVNTDEYPKWNPVMNLIEGTISEGNRVKYIFTQDKDSSVEISITVMKVTPKSLLNQKGGIPLILTYDHKYELTDLGDSTKMVIHEEYNGIGVNFWNPEPVEKAYKRLNEALKKRVESLSQ